MFDLAAAEGCQSRRPCETRRDLTCALRVSACAGYPRSSVACRWQAVSGMEAQDPWEVDDDDVGPFVLS